MTVACREEAAGWLLVTQVKNFGIVSSTNPMG